MKNILILLVLLLPVYTVVYANGMNSMNSDTVIISPSAERYTLDGKLEYFVDTSGNMDLDDVLRNKKNEFKSLQGETLSLGYTSHSAWMRFSVENPLSMSRELFLELVSYIDVVEIFIMNDDVVVEKKSAGRYDPLEKRDLPFRNFIYRLTFDEKSTFDVYMHFKSKGSLIVPLSLWSIEGFYQKDHDEQIIFGIFFGILIVMVLYNLFIFFSIRDISYLYYILFILFLGLTFANIWGFNSEYFWTNIWLANKSMIVFMGLAQLFGLLFTRYFLQTSINAPLIDKAVILNSIIAVIIVIMAFIVPYNWGVVAGLFFSITTAVLMLLSALTCFLKGYRPSRFFLIAFVTLIIGLILLSLRNFSIVPFNTLTNYSSQLGMALMVTFLSLALADRINIMKEEKQQMQAESLETQKKMTSSFARFVPDQFLTFLNREDITQVELGDSVERDMTILFTDIRSFTTLSEKMTPRENFSFINSFFKRMGPVIRKHGGFIDKYLGDSIMALFPDSPDDAVAAAVEMIAVLEEYNKTRIEAKRDILQIGIGIHTGRMMLGTIGESERIEGTVISDAVNLASRIEGLTKVYDTDILVSKDTFDLMKIRDAYKSEFVDRVKVKGKDIEVSVFGITGIKE